MYTALDYAPRDELLERECQRSRRRADCTPQLGVARFTVQGCEDGHGPLFQDDVFDFALPQLVQDACASWSETSPAVGENVLGTRRMAVAGVTHHQSCFDQRVEGLPKAVST